MKHDFDKVIDRRNTNSVKYDFAAECGMPEDVLPLWVADMDFEVAEPITTGCGLKPNVSSQILHFLILFIKLLKSFSIYLSFN